MTNNNPNNPMSTNNNPTNTNSTTITTTKIEKNPWESINDMLIHNKCWLCEQPFPRARTKKVFQVSHLLSFYHQLYMSTIHNKEDNNDNSNENLLDNDSTIFQSDLNIANNDINDNKIFPMNSKKHFISQNLQKCYDNYVYMMSMNENKPDLLLASFQKYDIEVWMSGLICGLTPSCKEELIYFVESKASTTNSTNKDDSNNNSKKIMNMSLYSNKDCPPGCGCDNPWPFLL